MRQRRPLSDPEVPPRCSESRGRLCRNLAWSRHLTAIRIISKSCEICGLFSALLSLMRHSHRVGTPWRLSNGACDGQIYDLLTLPYSLGLPLWSAAAGAKQVQLRVTTRRCKINAEQRLGTGCQHQTIVDRRGEPADTPFHIDRRARHGICSVRAYRIVPPSGREQPGRPSGRRRSVAKNARAAVSRLPL